MEKKQEMRQVDTTNQATLDVKARNKTDRSSGSGDESHSLSDSSTLAFKSLQALDLRIGPRSSKRRSTEISAKQHQGPMEKDIGIELYQLQKDYDDARNELRLAYRENRDQSLELRDFRKAQAISHDKNAHLQEQNAQLREAIRARSSAKLTKNEKAKYIEHFEMLEGHISHLQYEQQKRDSHMNFLTEQTREANEEKSSLERECRKLQKQVRELSNNLTECKDDLLRLQPTSQVPDNEIFDQYSDLDQQITGWVDDRTEDSEILEDQFEKIKAPENLPSLLSGYLSSEHLRMAKKYPESQPIMLRYLVHRCLGTFIFEDEIYLFGLDSGNVALLRSIEDGMQHLEPRRDAVTLRRWRSETLQGLLKVDAFMEEQNRQAKLVSQTLQSALSSLITHQPEEESGWEDLHSRVVLPAVRLATKLRLSTANYHIIPHIFAKDRTQSATGAFAYEIKDSSMIDIATHKVLRPDSMLKASENGRIGNEVLVIAPALLRAHKDGKGKVLICKPTVLVKLDEPMGKRSRGIKALGAWTPSWLGGEEAVA